MILITGAAGKTGKAIIQALSRRGLTVRAMVHHSSQTQDVKQAGAVEVVVGDLMDAGALQNAMEGMTAVYVICPNMCPNEVKIGRLALQVAKQCGVRHFVYHSVLHPQVEAMPHHWNKMRVEELIFTSNIDFTILQPSAYMQNVLAYWQQIDQQGIYALPYAPQSRLSLVELEDVAEVAALVLEDAQHFGSIYELVGSPPLSQTEVAQILTNRLGRPVQAVAIDRDQWVNRARASGMTEYAIETLRSMFEYYEQYGLWGSPRVLSALLGRAPRSFEAFIDKIKLEKSRG